MTRELTGHPFILLDFRITCKLTGQRVLVHLTSRVS